MTMIFQQTGDRVTGQLNANSADFGVIRESIVDGNSLRFKIVRAMPSPNGQPRDQYLGTGELVMDQGGKSFKGTVLGVPVNGTFIGR